jgi:Fe-S cluster biosynthesis and repair protein YggX
MLLKDKKLYSRNLAKRIYERLALQTWSDEWVDEKQVIEKLRVCHKMAFPPLRGPL